jgi:hypothetical protein
MFSILKKQNIDIQSETPVFGPYKILQNEWQKAKDKFLG